MKQKLRKVRIYSSLTLLVLGYSFGLQAKTIEVSSPNKELKMSIEVGEKITYNVFGNGQLLLENCSMNLQLKDQVLGKTPKLLKSVPSSVNNTIIPVIALKNKEIKNEYNSLTLQFAGNYSIEIRMFNDGMAYRFITALPGEIEVINEDISLNFPGDYLAHLQQTRHFKTSYENPYSHVETKRWRNENEMSTLPVLIDTRAKYKILISESDLVDYPCTFLKGNGKNGMYSLYPLCPLAFGDDGDRSVKIEKEADYIAKTKGTRNFPWRYFVITYDDRLIPSNEMTARLAQPCSLKDPSWIKPGKVSWEWWNDASPYGVDFVSGYNMDTYKYYIDFASKYGIDYIIMDEGWAESTRDPYTPNSTINLQELLKYGKDRNVGIVLWLTWLTVENHFDLFKTFKEWGVKGVKIDFMDRSDQWMVNFYERVAVEAAKNQLFVDFHGSFKPAGLEYKYPNIISYEGVRGMEQMGGCWPDNSLFFPFMRNAVGPMDYTPGAMLSMQPEVYCGRRPNSASIGTRAYQMALFVTWESGLQMLADNPTNYYRNHECTEYIAGVPTTWDETRVLLAEAGEYYVVAKRKGETWYIGGIVNSKETTREFSLELSFLKDGKTYEMTAFQDGVNAGRQAMDYKKVNVQVKKGDAYKIKMVRNGGWAAVLK